MPRAKIRKAVSVYCKECASHIPCFYTSARFVKYICPHNNEEKYLAGLAKNTEVKWNDVPRNSSVSKKEIATTSCSDTDLSDEDEHFFDSPSHGIDLENFNNEWGKLCDEDSKLTEKRKQIKKQKIELLQNLVFPLEERTGFKIKVSKRRPPPFNFIANQKE